MGVKREGPYAAGRFRSLTRSSSVAANCVALDEMVRTVNLIEIVDRPTASLFSLRIRPDLADPEPLGLVEIQSVGIGPLSGGNPFSAGNRRRSIRYAVGVWPVKSLNSLLKWA